MKKWLYDLGTVGQSLREVINTDIDSVFSCQITLDMMLKCFDWIKEHCPSNVSDYFESYREGVQESLDEIIEMHQYDDCDEEGIHEYAESIVNEWLETFYDSCDIHRIWIGL